MNFWNCLKICMLWQPEPMFDRLYMLLKKSKMCGLLSKMLIIQQHFSFISDSFSNIYILSSSFN